MKYYRHLWIIDNGKPLTCLTTERVLDDGAYELVKEFGVSEETYRVEEVSKAEYLKHIGAS